MLLCWAGKTGKVDLIAGSQELNNLQHQTVAVWVVLVILERVNILGEHGGPGLDHVGKGGGFDPRVARSNIKQDPRDIV